MKKEDLKIGQWYLPTNFNTYPFKMLKLTNDGIFAGFINDGARFRENQISNSDFWQNCKEIDGCPKEYQHLLPEEHKEKEKGLLIFN